jgi:hypothetical protein
MIEVLDSPETSVLTRTMLCTSQKTEFFIVTAVKNWDLSVSDDKCRFVIA